MPLPDVEQTIFKLIPSFIKPLLKPLYFKLLSIGYYQKMIRVVRPAKSREELHQYWSQPGDIGNRPQAYLSGKKPSQSLVEVIKRHCHFDARILEIGCNVGRNLNYLFLAGFRNLEGIEINEEAVQLLKVTYPEMSQHTNIYNNPVENIIKSFENDAFDLVFTMAVLEHIHPDSEWIFNEMMRITKTTLVTIEDENAVSWGIFPRNYKRIFESLGMKTTERYNYSEIGGASFLTVFEKPR